MEDLYKLKKINFEMINIFKINYLKKEKLFEKEMEKRREELKKLTSQIMKDNSLLMAMPLLQKYYYYKISEIFLCMSIMLIFLLTFDLFGIPSSFLSILNIIVVQQIALDYGFDENDIKNYKLEKNIFSEKKEKDENEIKKNLDKSKNFLEKLLLYTDGCQLYIKSFEIYQNVFKSFEKFGNMKNEEWNNFRENEI